MGTTRSRIFSERGREYADRFVFSTYRLLLRGCSHEFREEFGEEMVELAGVRLKRARRGAVLSSFRCWLDLITDLAVTATITRRQRHPQQDDEFEKETLMKTLGQDLKYSLRSLVAAPGFTCLALLLIGLGVGVNTAMFSIVDGLLFKPHPWKDADEVVWIYQDSDSGSPSSCSYPAFRDIASHDRLFSGTAAIITGRTVSQRTESGLVRQVNVTIATSEYFEVAGLKPLLGVDFDASHDNPSGVPAVIVSHRAWQRDFGADRNIVGTQVVLNGSPVTIVGVGPAGYRGATPGSDADYWLSISSAGPVAGPRYVSTLETRNDHWFRVLARLQPGTTKAQAQSAMSLLADRLAADFPVQNKDRGITVFRASDIRIHPAQDGTLRSGAGLLMGIVGLVLLVAAANLGNLLVARSTARERELAVRLAMGATRTRLVRLLLTEAMLLAVGGTVLAVSLSFGLARILAAVGPTLPVPMTLEILVDYRLLLFSLSIAMLTTLAFGLVPAMRATRPDLVPALKDAVADPGRRRVTWWPQWLTMRNCLVMGQISTSLVLVVAAGLLVRSLLNTENADLGFQHRGLAVIEVDVRQAGYEGGRAPQFLNELQERIGGLPGVDSVVATTALPVTPRRSTTTLLVERDLQAGDVQKAEVPFSLVRTDFFSTLGIPMLHGRPFLSEELASYSSVAIVNRAFAEQLLGGVDVVGRTYRHENQPETAVRIVGVVENSKIRMPQEPPSPGLYRVLPSEARVARLLLVARTQGDPSGLPGLMRGELQAMDPNVPIYQLETMSEHIDRALTLPRWGAQMLAAFALLALVMAAVGLYSVVSYLATQRRTEMGIRIALGATRGGVVTLFLRRMMLVAFAGILVGLGLTALLQPVLQGLLFGVPVLDPLTVGAVVVLLMLVAALATYIPARRASRVDPLTSIRTT